MTTGEGIFFGFVFLGLIGLYAVTKDRWNWKRLAKWSVVVVVVPIVGISLWVAALNYLDARPQVEQALWGIKPGISVDELVFLKGKASGDGKEHWLYSNDAGVFHVVSLKNSKVQSVTAVAWDGNTSSLPSIQGISNYSTQVDIENKFGAPDHVSVNKEKTRRTLSFLKYQLFFTLEKGKVVALRVFDPKEGPQDFEERPISGRWEILPDDATPTK